MINRVQIVGVYVSDQDRALAFFTETLGFELVADNPFGDGQRWLQVRPPGAETSLALFTPPGMKERIGGFANIVFSAPDIEETCAELARRGVEFSEPPTRQPWGGLMAQFKDPDGNTFVMHE